MIFITRAHIAPYSISQCLIVIELLVLVLLVWRHQQPASCWMEEADSTLLWQQILFCPCELTQAGSWDDALLVGAPLQSSAPCIQGRGGGSSYRPPGQSRGWETDKLIDIISLHSSCVSCTLQSQCVCEEADEGGTKVQIHTELKLNYCK